MTSTVAAKETKATAIKMKREQMAA